MNAIKGLKGRSTKSNDVEVTPGVSVTPVWSLEKAYLLGLRECKDPQFHIPHYPASVWGLEKKQENSLKSTSDLLPLLKSCGGPQGGSYFFFF